jgi:hypothetical protein
MKKFMALLRLCQPQIDFTQRQTGFHGNAAAVVKFRFGAVPGYFETYLAKLGVPFFYGALQYGARPYWSAP